MAAEMGHITQLAWNILTDEDLLLEKYSSPEEVLDYLANESNFKKLSEQLKETMVKAGICEENADQTTFSSALFKRIQAQNAECGTAPVSSNSVRRWFNGEIKSLKRDRLIEICFALSLSYKQATEFLNKCGYSGFNIRNAQDAVYMYCILNNKPLASALSIMDSYSQAPVSDSEAVQAEESHCGQTTIMLEKTLFGNSSWESDDDFLRTFLIPNKNKFIGYTNTALKEYYSLKNSLFISVFIHIVTDINHLTFERKEDGVDAITRDDISIPLAFKSAIRKYDREDMPLYQYNQELREDMTNTLDVMKTLKKLIDSSQDLSLQKEISIFFADVMKMEGFLKHVFSSIRDAKDRIRAYGESELSGSVMKEFPTDRFFMAFESNPGGNSQSITMRKAIILMYYMAYAYEYFVYLGDYRYMSQRFKNMGFKEFMGGLNRTLNECKLAPLYPANQFDWLILRSIRHFEIYDVIEDEELPTKFFNDVLAFSFGEIIEEDID